MSAVQDTAFRLRYGRPRPAAHPSRCSVPNLPPVTLTTFRATLLAGQRVSLNWTTASERGNARFTIERSTDAIHFYPLGAVPGAGNAAEARHYAWEDGDPLPGLSYYRLQQTDFNGASEYSALATVARTGTDKAPIHLYPTASADGVFTLLGAPAGSRATLRTSLSRVVLRQELDSSAATTLDARALPGGVYVVQVESPEGRLLAVRRVVVDK